MKNSNNNLTKLQQRLQNTYQKIKHIKLLHKLPSILYIKKIKLMDSKICGNKNNFLTQDEINKYR